MEESKIIEELRNELEIEKESNKELQLTVEQLARENTALRNSFSWKCTRPLRLIYRLWDMVILKRGGVKALGRAFQIYANKNGFFPRVIRLLIGQKSPTFYVPAIFSKKDLVAQKAVTFPESIKVSIVVPLYNTPVKFLREMIQSVMDQTYANWELCMADGSDEQHENVERICLEYRKKDTRILYQKLPENRGISGNTNACLDMATGEYIALLDHDDILHPAALFEVVRAIHTYQADFLYTDEATFNKRISNVTVVHYKPDFAPDNLRANNYICHFTSFKAALLDTVGRFDPKCDGSQDHDMVLRLTEIAKKIVHIPEVLYYWRAHAGSVAGSVYSKPYVAAAHCAISQHLQRLGLEGKVYNTKIPNIYGINYIIKGTPLISILIPNYEHLSDLKKCLESVYEKSTYSNFEIIIIENNSQSEELFAYYAEMQRKHSNLRVVTQNSENGTFNYSALNNYGATFAHGEYLLLLNNDTEVISPDWLEQMLMFCQRSDVGAVGAKLYYPDDTVQHAGVVLGMGGCAAHISRGEPKNEVGYMGRLCFAQDCAIVTGACVMVRKNVWDQVAGLDESFRVEFNDTDLCMRIRKAGYLIVWTPFAELYHFESKSRGNNDTPEKKAQFERECVRFKMKWKKEIALGDPYFNPVYSLDIDHYCVDSLENIRKRLKQREELLQ